MAYTVVLTPKPATGVIGAVQTFTATTAGAADAGTDSFVWTVDGVSQASTASTLDYTITGPAGTKNISVTATHTPTSGPGVDESANDTTILTVSNKTITATLALSPVAVNAEIGTTTVVTATVTGAPVGATITYVWKRNNNIISGQSSQTISVSEANVANYTLKCEATIVATDYTTAVLTKDAVVTITLKTMTLGCTIVSDKPTVSYGEQFTLTATPSGVPSGARSNYIWKKGGVAIAGAVKGPVYTALAGDVGTDVYSCTLEVIHPDYTPANKTSNDVSLTIDKANQQTMAVLVTDKLTITTKQSSTLTVNVANAPTGSTFKYEWTVDGIAAGTDSNKFVFSNTTPDSYEIVCKLTVTNPNYNDYSSDTNEVIIVVKTASVDPTIDVYIHPLPSRNSAYIWCGWWVMVEIQRIAALGGNWKTDEPTKPYYQHRLVLANMLEDYPEVDVQESRNGYIVHRTALELGIIYDYY